MLWVACPRLCVGVRVPSCPRNAVGVAPGRGRANLSERTPMDVRYYLDADTGQPHVYSHGVTEREVEEVLRGRGEDLRATGNSRRKIGQTSAGRYLQVFYVPDEDPDSVFVITAYEPQGKAKRASVADTEGSQNEKAGISPWVG